MNDNNEYTEAENLPVDEKKSSLNELLEWLEAIAIAIMVVLLVFTFVLRQVMVVGDSMNPTLYDGERLIMTHLFYTPKQGDIVVANCVGENKLNKSIIKRVIATEGQTIDIDFETGEVTVDGEVLEEDYINALTTTGDNQGYSYPLTVPEGCVFVMGDNRNHSTDSRYSVVGFINVEDISGKAVFRISPIGKFGFIE